MPDSIKAILLGVVEGITEFLPISSTSHLVLFSDLLHFDGPIADTFAISIQLGAILAIILTQKEVFIPFLSFQHWKNPISLKIGVATAPALVLGFICYPFIKTLLFSTQGILIGLGVGAILMLLTDTYAKKRSTPHTNNLNALSYRQAFYIGLSQCAALWPGMSRSGATIMGGIVSGLSYECATRFSFLIAVPIISAAVVYNLLQSLHTLTFDAITLIGLGFISSFCIGYLSIISLICLLKRFKLAPFAYYRLCLCVILFIMLKP